MTAYINTFLTSNGKYPDIVPAARLPQKNKTMKTRATGTSNDLSTENQNSKQKYSLRVPWIHGCACWGHADQQVLRIYRSMRDFSYILCLQYFCWMCSQIDACNSTYKLESKTQTKCSPEIKVCGLFPNKALQSLECEIHVLLKGFYFAVGLK